MARRRDYTRPFVVFTGAALLVGSIATVYKVIGTRDSAEAAPPQPNPLVVKTPAFEPPKPIQIKTIANKPEQKDQPTTRPTAPATLMNPTTAPSAVAPSVAAPRLSSTPSALFADADAKIKADDLIAARNALVDAVGSKQLSESELDEALRRLNTINETVVFSPRKFNSDQHAIQHQVKPGESLQKIAKNYDVSWEFIGRLNGISEPRKLQSGKSLKIIKGPFHALVSKKHFTLDVYIGKPGEPASVFMKRFRVGLGEKDSTPTGTWLVKEKLPNPTYYNPRADGPRVIDADDPKNPLGERWIALEGQDGEALGKTSYGIHGTIEPDSIGKMKSLGCVRMLNEDVELVYDLLIPGKSTVRVVE